MAPPDAAGSGGTRLTSPMTHHYVLSAATLRPSMGWAPLPSYPDRLASTTSVCFACCIPSLKVRLASHGSTVVGLGGNTFSNKISNEPQPSRQPDGCNCCPCPASNLACSGCLSQSFRLPPAPERHTRDSRGKPPGAVGAPAGSAAACEDAGCVNLVAGGMHVA